MASPITITHAVSTATSTNNAATYTSGSFTPAVGDVLVAFVVGTADVGAGSMTSTGGYTGTWTRVTTALKASSADTLYMFISDSFVTAASASTVIFTGGGAATGNVIEVVRLAGMSKAGLTAVVQSAKTSNAASGTPAPAFSGNANTINPTLGFIANATNPATMTTATGWTEQNDTGYATPTTGAEYITRISGFASTTITWGSSSASAFGAIIAELDAAQTRSAQAQVAIYPFVQFVCGGEKTSEPTGSHWNAVNGSVTKDATHVLSGSNALKFSTSAGFAYVTKSITAGNRVLVGRFSLFMPSLPASTTRLWEWQAGGFVHAQLQTDGKIYLNATASTATLPLNQWVTIDFKINTSANPNLYDWKINGVAQTQSTNGIAAADITNFFLGDSDTSTADWWVDDFAITYSATDYPIPNGSVSWNGTTEVWTSTNAVTTSNGFAQAQVKIKATSSVFSQAQTDIKATSFKFSQAQADIKATAWAFAQSQADIKAIGRGFSQSQADIKATAFVWSQAQAKIKATSFGLAQANADIKATSFTWSQAQADIKATSSAFAQAQAKITNTGFGLAQAQAKIRGTSQGYAQAQTDIKAKSSGFAQAQARIKQTYLAYAQAQADIKATSRGYGQAQADIKARGSVFAQSRVWVRSQTVVEAQGQALIRATYQGYAQAQALILATYSAVAQAQAKILPAHVREIEVRTFDRPVITTTFVEGGISIALRDNALTIELSDEEVI